MGRVEEILKNNGPMLSGKLATEMEKIYSISNEAARKAISRARSPVQKVKVFPFNKNQVFCYLKDQYMSVLYRKRLYHALQQESAAVSAVIYALENANYIMKKSMLPIYSKSPIENTKGHRKFDRIILNLIAQEIIIEIDEEYYAISPMYSGKDYNLTYSKSEEIVAKIAVSDFITKVTKLNIVAYNSWRMFPEEAVFAHFKWFATVPSYVTPLYDITEKRPGFMVIDVLIKAKASVKDVSFFVEKINIIRNFKGIPPVAPVILITGASKEALQYLKENKIVIGVLANLFDRKYTEVLMNMYNVLRNATTVIMKEPQKLELLLKEIGENEGKFNNAMGDLFECMVGLYFAKLGVRYLELNKEIPNENGGRYEMDILVERDGKIFVIECKAYKGKLGKDYVESWLSHKIPVFRRFLDDIYPGKNKEFSIWALGGYDKQAEDLLAQHKSTVKKYELSYLDKNDIYQRAKDANDRIFCEHIKRHFRDYGEK